MIDIHWPNTRFVISVAQADQFPQVDLPQIAVAGHSNVGKSSLLNALFARKGLVKTSKRPGCTRLLNLFEVDQQLLLVDLPGYGYARAAKGEKNQWRRLIERYLDSTQVAQIVLVLLDIRHGPKDSDLQLIEWLNEGGIRWVPVATKADKLTGNDRAKRLKEMTKSLGMLTPLATSATDQRGIADLRTLILHELAQQRSRFEDEELSF
ncbi:MAG: YihA family ribosome biogenesis GTP-binding protein [Zetaproteobacteria bacterium]|nr:YihA family ribosome biogenesis GTP-binding protein [Zetaproteobacteria bacterium]